MSHSILTPEYHPMVANPTMEEIMRMCATEEGVQRYAKWLNDRKRLIELAENDELGDPYRHGWKLPHYKVANERFKTASRGQYIAGGKRATKSERSAWLTVHAAMRLPNSLIWAFQGNDQSSKAQQQALIWKYLPAELKRLNGKARHGWTKVTYSPDNGFANRIVVFPNRSRIMFMTYSQDPKEFQGFSLGAKMNRALQDEINNDPELFNLGAWLDEDVTLPWLDTVETRCTDNKAKWMLTFSTMDGITPAVASIVTGARTVEHQRAPLLSERQKFADGCPPGHLPTIQESVARPGVSIVYFWTQWNPFGSSYEGVKQRLEGKSTDVITQDAYGWSRDTKRRAYPKFGSQNIIPVSALPAKGTNYHLLDLAGNRMWNSLWVRVAPGKPEEFFFYRDWPDKKRFGEWAKPGATNDQPDGVMGDAQKSRGYGWIKYKQTFLQEEKTECIIGGERLARIKELLPHVRAQNEAAIADFENFLKTIAPDPQVREAFRVQLIAGGYRTEVITGQIILTHQEKIAMRYIDPRAGASEDMARDGSTTPIAELARTHNHAETGETLAPGMLFRPASGVGIDIGLNAVNEKLYWDNDQEYCPVVNQPHLFVTENCEQIIPCMLTYTGLGGEKGGWKDFSDLIRYACVSGLRYIDPDRQSWTPASGGY